MLPSSRIANHLTLRPRDRVEIVYSGRILVQDTSSRTRSISSRSFFFRLRTRVLESGLLSKKEEGGRLDDWLDHRIIGRTLLVIRHTVIRTIMSVYVRLLLCACPYSLRTTLLYLCIFHFSKDTVHHAHTHAQAPIITISSFIDNSFSRSHLRPTHHLSGRDASRTFICMP